LEAYCRRKKEEGIRRGKRKEGRSNRLFAKVLLSKFSDGISGPAIFARGLIKARVKETGFLR